MSRAALNLVHFIPAGMLLLALGHWPYGYYMLLRVVVFAVALLLASFIYQQTKSISLWAALFVITAVIFNPFIPPHLTRGVWSILNILTAGLFVGHFVAARRHATEGGR